MNKLILALIAAIATSTTGAAMAGAVNGPQVANTRVEANRTDVYQIRFFEGELARVSVRGDRDTDLDVTVKDRFGNVMCTADGPTDVETCRFVPDETARYRIEVKNLGNVWNAYRLTTN